MARLAEPSPPRDLLFRLAEPSPFPLPDRQLIVENVAAMATTQHEGRGVEQCDRIAPSRIANRDRRRVQHVSGRFDQLGDTVDDTTRRQNTAIRSAQQTIHEAFLATYSKVGRSRFGRVFDRLCPSIPDQLIRCRSRVIPSRSRQSGRWRNRLNLQSLRGQA